MVLAIQAAKRPNERMQALWVTSVATATKENPENKVQAFERVIDDGEWEDSRTVLGVEPRLAIHRDVYDCAWRQERTSEQLQPLSFQKNAVLQLSFLSHTLQAVIHIIPSAPRPRCDMTSYAWLKFVSAASNKYSYAVQVPLIKFQPASTSVSHLEILQEARCKANKPEGVRQVRANASMHPPMTFFDSGYPHKVQNSIFSHDPRVHPQNTSESTSLSPQTVLIFPKSSPILATSPASN